MVEEDEDMAFDRVAGPDPEYTDTGLTGAGLVVISTFITLTAGIVDAVLTGELSTVFGIGFLVGSLAAAALARHVDRWAVVVAPPLVFTGTATIAGQLTDAGDGYGFLLGTAIQTAETLTYQAPWMLAGTAAAAVVSVVRHRGHSVGPHGDNSRPHGGGTRRHRPRGRRVSR